MVIYGVRIFLWSSLSNIIATVGANGLYANVKVLDLLPNGTIELPAGTRRIFLEVGANSEDNVDLEELEWFPRAFLISFEPLLHQYGALLSRRSKPNKLRPLGQHHQRGIVLPFAVAREGEFSDLKIAGASDGCASLLAPQTARHGHECANRAAKLDVRRVPVVSLRKVIGEWLALEGGGNWPIDYLKIDAQGLDMEILRSAEDLVQSVLRVELELPADECERMYNGSLTCSEIVEAMAQLGYSPAYGQKCSYFLSKCWEDDWEFVRVGVKPLHDGLLQSGRQCFEGFPQMPAAALEEVCCTAGLTPQKGRTLFDNVGCWSLAYRRARCCADFWSKFVA